MTTSSEAIPDAAHAEMFASHMITIFNHGLASVAISIGHRTGLFDAMAGLSSATSGEIASAAGANERYVREWLAAMVTAKIVSYEPATSTYRLPHEHASFVTRSGGPDNIAFFTQYVALVGQVESRVVDAVRKGGGVGYEHFPDFQRLQAEETARVYDAKLISEILPVVPGLVERLQSGIDAADIGCGAGHALNLMAEAFPSSRFVGYDISAEGVGLGRLQAEDRGLTNVAFEVRDLAALEIESAFDLITAFDVIHDQVRPREVLRRVAAALRPDGVFLMADIAASSRLEKNLDHPFGPALYSLSLLHCMTVSLAHGGEGLGTMWGEEKAIELLGEAGFGDIEVRKVDGDVLNSYYIARI